MSTEVELRRLISEIPQPQWDAITEIITGQLQGLEHFGDAKLAANAGCLTHVMGGINQLRYLVDALQDWRLPVAAADPVLKQTSI